MLKRPMGRSPQPDHRARVLLRLVVEHASREALEIFSREIGSIGISFAPGTTGIYSGRPKPTPVVRLFTFFLDKKTLGFPRLQIGDSLPMYIEIPLMADICRPSQTVRQPQT